MVLTKCPIQNGTELWTPGDEYNKFWREGSPTLLSNLGLPSLEGDLLYSSPGVQSSVPFLIGHFVSTTRSGRHFSRLTCKFYGVWWLRVATWRCFSGIMVWRNSYSTNLACLFSDWICFSRKKSCLFWVDRSPDAGFRLLPCHYIMKEGERGPFSPKLGVRIKDNNSSPHGKFYRFLLPFSSKFSDLNLASYVLYILIPT